jgi:PAS domain-containing protein
MVKQNPTPAIGDVHTLQISKELLSQNRHLEVILEDMSEGILETRSDSIIYANSAAQFMLGASLKTLLGSSLT